MHEPRSISKLKCVILICCILNASALLDSNYCNIPKPEQEFCNSFYSVCISTPEKLCLAESMGKCIGSTGFPKEVIQSMERFLLTYIEGLPSIASIEVPGNISNSFLPAPKEEIITLPHTPSTPIILPPIPLKRVEVPDPIPVPLRPPIIITERKTTLAPIPIIPEKNTPFIPPTPEPIVDIDTIEVLSEIIQVIPEKPETVIEDKQDFIPQVPEIPENIAHMLPDFLPPLPELPDITKAFHTPPTTTTTTTTEAPTTVEVTYSYSQYYVDYLLALLEFVKEEKVKQYITYMVKEKKPIYPPHKIDRANEGREVSLLINKLEYILNNYTDNPVPDTTTLKYMLGKVFEFSNELFQWLVQVVDKIFSSLKIESLEVIDERNDHTLNKTFKSDYNWRRNIKKCHPNADETYCERYCTDEYGGNWIGIQARERETVNYQSFDQDWQEYAVGFGDWEGGYWMGLNCLHAITSTGPHELLIELADADGNTALAHYGPFAVYDLKNNYELYLGKYKGGSAGDSFSHSNGTNFSTRDNVDQSTGENCAQKLQGGWWFDKCQQNDVNNVLNGFFNTDIDLSTVFEYSGIGWDSWKTDYDLVSTRMFMRKEPLM